MFNAKALTEKWDPVLNHEGTAAITDNYKKSVTAVLLENQERFLREERGMLQEAGRSGGNVAGAISATGGQNLRCLIYTSDDADDTP